MSQQDRGNTSKSLVLPIGVGVLSIAAIVGGVGVFAAAQASGAQLDKVQICHRTSAQNNPYTVNDVDTSSIDNDVTDKKYLNGHGDHTGPVFTPGASSWGDIIPPFTSSKGNSFPGYNWLNGGQAIWANGCALSTPSPTPTPTDTSSGSPTPTDTSSGSPTPTETSSETSSPTPSETTSGSGSPSASESGSATPTDSGSGSPTASQTASTPTGGGETTGGGTTVTPGEASAEATAPGAATVAPGTVILPTEMPNPVNVAPGAVNIAPGTVTSVPAGNGELVLSLAGMTLIGGGIAGVAGTSVWIADRRRRRTA